MTQNFVKVSQEHKHIIVKNAGGLRGLTGETGPQGPAGADGRDGADGISATVAVGTTTTLPAGSSALVTNTGTNMAAVFNFGIPKGDKGDKGDAGAGLIITGSVDTYADLPNDLGPDDAGKAYFVQADGKLYIWSGTQFPADGEGSQFEGPQGPQGPQGATGQAGQDAPLPSAMGTASGISISLTDAGPKLYSYTISGDMSQTGTPTPSVPVSISTVTGTQTVTISDGVRQTKTQTIRLGSLELCKLGDYQDYIYYDNGDWYVHKEIKSMLLDNTYTWEKRQYGTNAYDIRDASIVKDNSKVCIMSDRFIGVSYDGRTSAENDIIFLDTQSESDKRITIRNTSWATLTEFTTWIASNSFTVKVVLASATNTKITDTDLISDLNDLLEGGLYEGTCSLTVTASSLPGSLSITYFTYYKGEQGETGATGAAGADGYSPTATVTKSGDTATISITDKGGTTTATVSDGAPGTTVYTDLTNVYYTDTTLQAEWDSVNGYYVVTTVSPIRTTAPLVGDKIRVQFDTAHTGSSVQIKVNSDSVLGCVSYPVTSTNADTATNITAVSTDRVYEFVKTQKTGQSAVWASLDDHVVGSGSITGTQIASSTVTSSNVDWTTINPVNYSTTEQVIGTWIDGSTLYRKVIDLGNLPDASAKNVEVGITGTFTVVSIRGSAFASGSCLPIPYTAPEAAYNIAMNFNAGNGKIQVTTGSNRSSNTGIAILEYTKSS